MKLQVVALMSDSIEVDLKHFKPIVNNIYIYFL